MKKGKERRKSLSFALKDFPFQLSLLNFRKGREGKKREENER